MERDQFYEDVTQDLKKNIETLHNRSQKTKGDLQTHEAVCAERYKNLLIALEKMDTAIEQNNVQIKSLHNLAIEGKVSLKTLIKLGAFIAFILGVVYTAMGVYSKIP